MSRFMIVGLVALLGGVAHSAWGQGYNQGDRVVCIADADVRLPGRVVDDLAPGNVLTVERTNGQYLWVNHGHPGWLDSRYVVPLDREAIDYLTALIRSQPNTASLYSGRGEVWKALDEVEIAIADYSAAIRLSPRNSDFYANRGNAWCRKKEYQNAIADYNQAIQLDPECATHYYNRGLAWYEAEEYDRAIADCNETMRLDPSYTSVYVNRGLAWQEKGNYAKAIGDFTEALRRDPIDATAYGARGQVHYLLGEYDQAIADSTQAIRLDPQYAAAYFDRGNSYCELGNHARGLSDFAAALRLDSEYTAARNAAAWVLATAPTAQCRNGQLAVELALKACQESDWENWGYLDTLAAAYAELGDFDRAVTMQSKALALADADQKADLTARRKLYEQGRAYRDASK